MKNRIREVRQSKKLSLEELADKVGVSRTTIANYERHDTEPSMKKWQKLADALGVTVAYLQGTREKSGVDYLDIGNQLYSDAAKEYFDPHMREALQYFADNQKVRNEIIVFGIDKMMQAWNGLHDPDSEIGRRLAYMFIAKEADDRYTSSVKANSNIIQKMRNAVENLESDLDGYADVRDEQWVLPDEHIELVATAKDDSVSDELISDAFDLLNQARNEIDKLSGKYPNKPHTFTESVTATAFEDGKLFTSDVNRPAMVPVIQTDAKGNVHTFDSWLSASQLKAALASYIDRRKSENVKDSE